MSRRESYGWAIAFFLLAALAIPWYLWGNDVTVLGFPLWLWYHIGWMIVAALTFYVFGQRAWGVWIEEREPGMADSGGRL